MYDHKVFVVLTPLDRLQRANSAFKLPHNSKWFRKAVSGVAEIPTISSREATPADDALLENESYVERLEITFDTIENPINGIQFGTDPTLCHILLGHRGTKGISARQCNIVVDDNLCIWLNDYHSTHGTAVGYDGQNVTENRKRETWILAGKCGTMDGFSEIQIRASSLAFKVEFPNHRAADPRYIHNLRAFISRCKEAASISKDIPAMQGLGLDSTPTTQAPSEAQTPSERLIYYKEKCIGEGAFAKVYKIIRARNGKVFAGKTFTPPANKRKLDGVDPAWLIAIRKEFTLMRDNHHHNVMQVIEFQEKPEPMMIMDFYPDGNIADANICDEELCCTTMGQVLDGVAHLHKNNLVHRDLKPENLLLQRTPYFKVVITDFGLSKIATTTAVLKTFCGTLIYAAPEVFPGTYDAQSSKVDIWSLGVIFTELIYGIPTAPSTPTKKRKTVTSNIWRQWINIWALQLRQRLADMEDDLITDILHPMLSFEPIKRPSASSCLSRGFEDGLFERREADGLVTCAKVQNEGNVGNERPRTPTAAQLSIIKGNLWSSQGSIVSLKYGIAAPSCSSLKSGSSSKQ